ncbi:MAG TPA: efflux transporter outer membrane subunit [Methylophilaceae bacterium]
MRTKNSTASKAGLLVVLTLSLPACSLWPSYQTPTMEINPSWKETAPQGWQAAKPQDAIPKGSWWTLFNDAELSRLEQAAMQHNQTLQAAWASLQQTHALTGLAQAARLPTLDLAAQASSTQPSANRANNSNNSTVSTKIQKNINPSFIAAYEVDLFGRIAHDIESAQSSEQQAQANFENLRLILAADVATHYFNLRALDADLALLQQTVTLQVQALSLAQSRHTDGVATALDEIQQEALLSKTHAQLSLGQRQRALTAHALATLVGAQVNDFNLNAGSLGSNIPQIPTGLPADLLQRRPDIASAERAVAIANNQIGVAKTAWYPSLRLSASQGWQSTTITNLFDTPSIVWSVGANLSQTIFDGGRNEARIAYARAGHDMASAQYRQTVLNALQEVEDGLSTARSLADASNNIAAATAASSKALTIIEHRYQAGASSVLELISARQNLLDNQRQAQTITAQQWGNTVGLIKALGGGWQNTFISSAN